ncbi:MULTISPECIES: VWA-like domain-containing protein [unclassified Microcoleus]|uniref:vWA domain-containing protein n=1 Tax=unclassified Microcoleus TaxID=2642155 RepID=UPI002FD4EB46
MRLAPEMERLISGSLLRLRMKSPFFATLALFTHFLPTQLVPTAATDGWDIFFNPDFLRSLPPAQVDGLLLHKVLHAALLHVPRRGERQPELWNVSADIVVNGMIAQQGCFELPLNPLRDPKLEHLSVEEIYELLLQQNPNCSISQPDLLSQSPCDASGEGGLAMGKGERWQEAEGKASRQGAEGNSPFQTDSGSLAQAKQAALETHWRDAMQQALAIARSTNSQGSIPAGMQRELRALTRAKLDWRSYLWRYLVQTPTDFMGFDRRFIGRGLYLEALQGESVQVFVAVDTSGSIGDQQMQLFLSEVQGILKAYPHLTCDLYYADAQAYGPYSLESDSEIPQPIGGGGTSFVPFFDQVSVNRDWHSSGVCVYLTDGYGTFPQEPPVLPVLWVVTPGGLDLAQFPFGETVQLLSAS